MHACTRPLLVKPLPHQRRPQSKYVVTCAVRATTSIDPMARMHPGRPTLNDGRARHISPPPSAAILHAAGLTALVAVCLALCTIHSRNRKWGTERAGGAHAIPRRGEDNGGGGGSGRGGGSTAATTPAKVSPTPSDMAKKVGEPQAAAAQGPNDVVVQDSAAPRPDVTVIDVGTHGPIAPVFVAAPDPLPLPLPPRRSLSVKHLRFAERLGRIRSRRWGLDDNDGDDEDDTTEESSVRGGETDEGSVLWTKTIILGERCRVPTDDEDAVCRDVDGAMVRWKSYRPRQPRSLPATRSNSFAGVCGRANACRLAAARF